MNLNMFSFAIEMAPGTIVAWAESEEYDEPPNKWVIFDGEKIEEGPWKGKKTPDLRNTFLIGGEQKLATFGNKGLRLAPKNKEEFCFKNKQIECEENNETQSYSFQVKYIMKIPVHGLW